MKSKAFVSISCIIAGLNVLFGFFWNKGFYYCATWLALAGVAAFVFLFGGGILKKLQKLNIKAKFRKLLEDDEEAKGDKTEPDPAVAIDTTSSLTRAEYEQQLDELLKAYEQAIEDGDTSSMATIKDQMIVLKSNEPIKLDKNKEIEELKKELGI